MKFSDIMIYYDYNMSEVAKELGISRQCVAVWKKKNKVPFSKQCEIQVITNNKLKASKEDS